MKPFKNSLFVYLFFFATTLFSQSKFGERIILGTSLTYVFNTIDGMDTYYHEFTWNKNIAVNLNKRMYLGLSYLNIYTRGSAYYFDQPKNQYSMAGVFFQYDFLPKRKNRLFGEVSWNLGDYCTCGNRDPYQQDQLHYLGLGAGYDLPIGKFISLDFAAIGYIILGKQTDKYLYSQYVIGLNFDLIRDK